LDSVGQCLVCPLGFWVARLRFKRTCFMRENETQLPLLSSELVRSYRNWFSALRGRK
jgi:hypothetical protein